MRAPGIEEYDFFGENEHDFQRKLTTETVLVQGEHWKKTPFVTILIPTYKRPETLRFALESALYQTGFYDYQIIVVDNEGADINVETETSRLMREYHDEKIIYYRHKEPAKAKMDNVAKTARSKWIVFLHDDDMLSPIHLLIMSSIVEKHKKIKYLSVPHGIIYGMGESKGWDTNKSSVVSYRVRKYPKSYLCLGYAPGWLGAFINRKCFISIGGMPSINTGLGDYCMEGKFMFRYGVYELEIDNKLYAYRIWEKQVSAASEDKDIWTKVFINKIWYHRYVAKKCHPFTYEAWRRIAIHQIMYEIVDSRKQFSNSNTDIERVLKECQIDESELEQGKQYFSDMTRKLMYEIVIEKFWPLYRYSGKIAI